MKFAQRIALLCVFSTGAIAIAFSSPQKPRSHPSVNSLYISQQHTFIPGSIKSDLTFSVMNNGEPMTVSLCGIAVSEENALAERSRFRLKELLSQQSNQIIVVPTEIKSAQAITAEIFVSTDNPNEEIHVGSQLLLEGLAIVSASVEGCPNGNVMKGVAVSDRDDGSPRTSSDR